MKTLIKANAKLNLMLDILAKLPNGYHDLFMVMQSVDLADLVALETTGDRIIRISCSNPSLPTDERNLAYRAAKAFFDACALPCPGLSIRIEKRIPLSAGLAGGSADAAAVLFGLNQMMQTALPDRKLIEIGSQIGADVPFCLLGGLMLAQYTGTVLSYLPALPFGAILIVKPEGGVSTAEAYAAFDTAERVRHLDRQGMLRSLMTGDTAGVYGRINNVFEQFIDVPERVVIKAALHRHHAACACMSGSGPSVFGIFENPDDAEAAAAELKLSFKDVFLCRAVGCGCEAVE